MKENQKRKIYLSQKELAERWNISEGTLINWRKQGLISYFHIPGSKRILYPYSDILELEKEFTKKEVIGLSNKFSPNKKIKKEPVISANSNREWRI